MLTHVGQYTLLDRLGTGGMGTVYLAHDRAGNTVAVKVLHERLATDRGFLARFAVEVAAARRVAGFCTARVLDAQVDGPAPYLVTEHVPGPTLRQVLQQQGPLPASQAEALAVGIAAALTAIHAAGVVHRDLKPSNVLLSTFGPKVIDFGIAKALDAAAPHTEAGLVLGTLGWMAPEQLHGQAAPASDVYVWGLLITHAGTGWRSAPELRAAAPAADDLARLPPSLAAVVTDALNPDPARRPAARDLLLRLCGSAEPAQVRTATAVLTRPWDPTYTHAPQPKARPVGAPPAKGPPAAARPAVGRRRRRWYRRKRVLIPAALLAVVAVLSNSDDRPPAATLPPLTARDGIIEFTATDVACGNRTLGRGPLARHAQGQLCTVALRVRNFGADARKIHVSSQKLRDQTGRAFTADTSAWLYLPESVPFFQQDINPGNEITATLVYDIAIDAVPAALEVHDSPFSGGATITL